MQRNKTSIAVFSTNSQPVKVAPLKAPKRTAEVAATQKKIVEKSLKPEPPKESKLDKVLAEQTALPSINTFRMLSVISGKRVAAGQDVHTAVSEVLAQYAALVEAALTSQKDVPTIPQLDIWFAAQYPASIKPIKTVKSEEPAAN